MSIEIIYFLLGLAVGFLAAILVWLRAQFSRSALIKLQNEQTNKSQVELAELRERLRYADEVQARLLDATRQNNQMAVEISRLKTEALKSNEFFEARISDLAAVHANMKAAFQGIAHETLVNNTSMVNDSLKKNLEHFFKVSEGERAKQHHELANVVMPLKESLQAVGQKVSELEKVREGAYSGLKEQVGNLLQSQNDLQKQTHNLVRALNAPTIRGRWGEMQLRRVVELSGMSAHCDFLEQVSVRTDKETFRPDMIVTLPQNRKIVIDAKAPMEGLFESADEEGARKYDDKEMANSLRRHLLTLKKRSYFKVIGQSPEFVVMFLPGEVFLHRAMLADPDLIEFAAINEVVIATPATLIATLKAISFSFKQEAMAQNIEEARMLAQQLIDRVHKVSEHFEKLGKQLRQANECYNQTLVSLDSRVLVTARKLADLKSGDTALGLVLNDSHSLPMSEPMAEEISLGDTEGIDANDAS
jgi:DNA recombination protein RmuC